MTRNNLRVLFNRIIFVDNKLKLTDSVIESNIYSLRHIHFVINSINQYNYIFNLTKDIRYLPEFKEIVFGTFSSMTKPLSDFNESDKYYKIAWFDYEGDNTIILRCSIQSYDDELLKYTMDKVKKEFDSDLKYIKINS